MSSKFVVPIIASTLVACSILNMTNESQPPVKKSYNAGYNAAVKSCNNILYYQKKYDKSDGVTTSAKSSLWGLLTAADIGYANSLTKFAGQKDAVNNIAPINKKVLYSQASFLDKCNYNNNYAEFCKTAYKEYINGYQTESANLRLNNKQQYLNGFNDATNNCNKQFASPPSTPLKPIE